MADADDGEIRRRVVGALMMQRLAALGAMIGHFEIAPEHRTLAAGRAFQHCTAQQRT
jgi:hypothetical protein